MGSQREYVRQNLNREDVDMARTVNHVVHHHRGLRAELKRDRGEIGRSYRTYAYLRMRFWDRIVDAVSQLPLSSAVMRDKRERECHASVPYDHHATVIVSVGSEGCFEELIASVLGYICFKLNSWHALLGEIL